MGGKLPQTSEIIENGKQCLVPTIDISKSIKMEEKLKKSHSLLRSILEIQEGITIFSIDENYRYLYFNNAHSDRMKSVYNSDIQLGENILNYITPKSDSTIAKKNFDRALKGESHSNNSKFEESEIAYFENFFNPIIVNNEIIGITCLSKNITKRIERENALSISEDKYRALFDSNRDSITIFRFTPDGKPGNFIEANTATTELFGYTREELMSMGIRDVESVSQKTRKKRIETLQSDGQLDFETFLKTKKGKTRNVEIKTLIVNYLNEPAVMNITRDITEQKQIEINARKTQENLATILEAIPDLLFEVGSDGRIHHYQAHRLDLLAVPPEVFMGKRFQDVLPADAVTICMEALQEADKKGWSNGKHYSLDLSSGKHWFELAVSPISESNPKDKHFILLARDITERKLAEEKSIANENFLTQTQIIANIGSYSFDFASGNWTSTAVLDHIFGIDANYEKTIDGWISIIDPEWQTIMNNYLNNEVIGKKNNFNKEYKIIKIDSKEERWVHGIGKITFSKEGQPLQLIGSIQDITERKLTNESLRESEEKYRSLVENSPDAVVIYIDGKIIFVNDETVHMAGAKNKEEIIGKSVMQFIHPDSVESIIKRMEEVVLDSNASAVVEEKFMDLLGNPIDVEIKAIPTIYDHKEAVQVIIHDITKRKQSLLELNKMNRVYSLISQINNLILRSKNREELLSEICRIAVTYGKFRMCWIGMLDDDGKTINTAAFYGAEDGYFSKDNEITILDEPKGKGPTGTSMREGRTVICNNIATDSKMKHWRESAIQRGYHSSISIPIVVLDKIIGSFNLYSEDTNSFSSEEEVELLEKITQNIAFTLESILFEEDRIHTQEKIQQLSQAVEQSPVTIVITNTKGNIEYVNPKFTETTGYTFDEVVGQNPRILKSGETSTDEYKELWQTLATGNEWYGEFHNIRKDGKSYWESASISPIMNVQGKTTHYIAIKEDITARKLVEKELIKAKEKAEESDRLKLAFLANMSHEIRTPMNGILGFTELLKEPKLSGEEQQEYIEIIEKSGKRMLNIINDIINISKVESGQVEISLSETNLNEQLEYIHTFFKPETVQKGIKLSATNLLHQKEAVINTDKEKVYAILTNLVKNAIKFTDSGSIEFGCIKKGKNLEFFVKDSGFGISESYKKIIFERFRQANESLTRSHEGSGLGLAISKAYVEMLGGKIWVDSEEGKGSTFYFTIPATTKSMATAITADKKEYSDEKEENQIKDLKILIVEDDEISKLLITIAVKTFSKEILKVSTGFEAIEACRNNPDIDLVMMDINMPEMGGYEATEKIREFNKDVVIIAQTANGMQSDRDEAIAAGCTDYISKPININSLSELIQKYFKK